MSHQDDDSGAMTLFLPDEDDTRALGTALAQVLVPALRIYLEGDLGSGKTTLVRAALRALGFSGTVRSPTFTLLELYAVSKLKLYHFDFYRFEDPQEFADAGLDEYFADDGVCLVEWPAKAGDTLPPADLRIRLEIEGEGRRALCSAHSPKGLSCLAELRKGHRCSDWARTDGASS